MKVLVVTTVYPNEKQPNLGVFVRERISCVAKFCELKVLAPVPYFPLALAFRRKYNINVPKIENQQGIEVHHPRFFVIPGIMKALDGFLLYLSAARAVKNLEKHFDFDLIDSHFAYPDGFAAVLLGKHFKKPVTITLRGTLNRLINYRIRKQEIKFALKNADKVFSVSAYLAKLAKRLGIDESKFEVIPNGIDAKKFLPLNKFECRKNLGIDQHKKVIISVGALVHRKGHHLIIEVLPELIKRHADVLFLVVGGPSVEGDISNSLKEQVQKLKMTKYVQFTGEVPHAMVNRFLCASDVFALATRYEGWANVFLEAMACGLPVVTTDVCGNSEVIKNGETGLLVPFGNNKALEDALNDALERRWNRENIISYARSHSWEDVAERIYKGFEQILVNY